MLTTRWVASSHRAVKAVLHNFNALYEHFHAASSDRQLPTHTRNELNGMRLVISSKAFVENLLLMNDVLAELSMLSQVFQGESLTIRQAQCQIQWAIEGLKRRKESAVELYTLTESTVRSVLLNERKAHKSIPKAQFLQAVIDRLQQRLMVAEDNRALSEQFDALHSNTWPSDVSPPWDDGERLITNLCARFNMNVVEIIPQFREYLKSLNVGPALASLLLIENTVPISSAEAERGFSQMNLTAPT